MRLDAVSVKVWLESHPVAWHTRRMNSITLEYPDAWLAPLGTDAVRFAREAKLAAAMKLFETGRFTSGQAARFAGMERIAFLLSCRQWAWTQCSGTMPNWQPNSPRPCQTPHE